ncbi:hypothetical protein AB1L07_02195 [Niallia alba]|uniref:hypothetical protein n=1 Tax=Niallia alba TaxID=2729105 RepID=UPI0039A2D53C
MFDMDHLYKIMESGWNIQLECKGKGREYEMSFEASAYKVVTSDMSEDDKIMAFYPIHAVGDTLEEITDSLLKQIKLKESK